MKKKENLAPATNASYFEYLGLFCELPQKCHKNRLNKIVKVNTPYPYKLCKIVDRKGDLSKRWYIEYYIFDASISRLRRMQHFCSAKIKTSKERIKWLESEKVRIDYWLKKGAYVDQESLSNEKQPTILSLSQAVTSALEQSNTAQKKRGIQTRSSFVKIFLEWASIHNCYHILPSLFTSEMAHQYIYYISSRPEVKSARTVNNHRDAMKSIFQAMVDRDIIQSNPFAKVKPKQVQSAPNYPFTAEEKNAILQRLNYWEQCFVKFMYYALLRKNEVRLLQVKDIDDSHIYVRPEVSKTGKGQRVIISPGLQDLILEMGIRQLPKDMYIFGTKYKPDKKPASINYYYNTHARVLKELGIEDKTLYSWKDTGICDLYAATKDVELVCRQARHHSLDMTRTYLKSVGMITDKANINLMPTL